MPLNEGLNRKLRFALVGGGQGSFIGGVHAIAAQLDSRAELVAGALSSDPQRAKDSAGDYGIAPERAYGSYQEMIAGELALDDSGRIDFVSIATPNHTHFEIARAAVSGDPAAIRFPRGLSRASDLHEHRYDFSFSGLKTAVARYVEQQGVDAAVPDIAASFREAVVDVLVTKALDACARFDVPRLLLGGGVIANRRLREVATARAEAAGVTVRIPPLSLCTDNGAMIAALAAELIASGRAPSTLAFGADSTLPVTEIQVAEGVPA